MQIVVQIVSDEKAFDEFIGGSVRNQLLVSLIVGVDERGEAIAEQWTVAAIDDADIFLDFSVRCTYRSGQKTRHHRVNSSRT